jgi:pimeloyl-ACP methyl ester carboxylesterase
MPGLIVFLHGLRGNKYSFGAVPHLVGSEDFEVVIPTYSASLLGRADIETSARRVVTEITTNYPDHSPIFFIGHSLGGLIARQICKDLLRNGPDPFLNKISAVITFGTPLEGARRVLNRVLSYSYFFSPKLRQIAAPNVAFDDYRNAISDAKKRKVSRPKQIHIQMEEDGVIARQIESRFTEDDRTGGVIKGTHRYFSSDNDEAKFVADLILRLLREAQNSLSAPNIQRTESAPDHALPDKLILIACSKTKREGGENGYKQNHPVSWVTNDGLRQRTINKRTSIYGILKDALLADGFERGGNRAFQPANQKLKLAPDLGGATVIGSETEYLPAWQRYSGRIYGPVTDQAWHNYFANTGRVRVLIMSGLYGLIEPQELIQNYDVHLTDTHIDSGLSVSSMWEELYTECLQDYVTRAYQGKKVHIFNLLGDHHYVDSVKWHKLPRQRCSVFHIASPTLEDIDLLPPAGVILNALLSNLDRLDSIDRADRDKRQYEMSYFGAAPEHMSDIRLVFESRVGNSKDLTTA